MGSEMCIRDRYFKGKIKQNDFKKNFWWSIIYKKNNKAVGTFVFHDYNNKFPGVMWSLDRFLARNDEFSVLLRADSLVVVRREGKNIISVDKMDLLLSKFMQIYLRLRRSVKKRLGKI